VVFLGFACGGHSHSGNGGADGSGMFVPDGGVCPGAGEHVCNNTCVNTQIDPNNCGMCGNSCGSGQVCLSSGCAASCPAPLSACDRTCVDNSSDNANCGTCGHACGSGMGCVGGSCVAEVPVGPDPAKCMNGGPPITVDPGTGTPTCTGNVVATTFTYGMCTCQDVGKPAIDSLFKIDAYNSNTGPYMPNGLGGSCGANGLINFSAEFQVTGDVRTTGTGLNVGGAMTIGQSLKVKNRLDDNDTLHVGMDAYVNQFGSTNSPATIVKDLYMPSCTAKPGNVSVGGMCHSNNNQPIAIDDPCYACGAHQIPVATLVTFYSDPSHNDNALINLNKDVFANPGAAPRLELPCGYYYLSSINGSSERVVGVHGRTAIFIGGNVSASSPITFTLTPGSTLDVFVGGSVSTGDQFNSGTPAYPSHSRFWVAGNVTTSANGILNGLFYAAPGTFSATSDLEMYGSIFAGNYSGSSLTNIHYDQAAADSGQECPTEPPPPQCTQSGATCQADSDCCQPLYCLGNHTCGFIIQ
jgi:hypothetical protein